MPKANAATNETDVAKLFDIVVCQVDHRIVCEPWADVSASSANASSGGTSRQSASACQTKKWVMPVAHCNGFKADVWKAGATCIANLAHDVEHVQCGKKVSPRPHISSPL